MMIKRYVLIGVLAIIINAVISQINTAHKKFMNTTTSAKSAVIIKFEGQYFENQTS